MKILKYLGVDIVSILSIIILDMIFRDYFSNPELRYFLLFIVCFLVAIIADKGYFHGISISSEIIILQLLILFMIGSPVSMPLSKVLNQEIIIPHLPFIPIGFLSGFLGEKIRKKWSQEKETS